MRNLITIVSLFVSTIAFGKGNCFRVIERSNKHTGQSSYFIVNRWGKKIKRLDSVYHAEYDKKLKHFAVVALEGRMGWWAIDENARVLFEVYNYCIGEPCPDELQEGMIRVVGDNRKVGFANHLGELVIQPQFEKVSSFSNGLAIVGIQCREERLGHYEPGGCNHSSVVCIEYGYINRKGEVQKMGYKSFEEVLKATGWNGEH